MAANKPLHAICVKKVVITNQIAGTEHEMLPGQLLKIIFVNLDSYIIKLYDHDNKDFGKDLLKCDKKNIKVVDDNLWSVISQLKKGDNVTVNLAISSSNRIIEVNFRIKNICDIPSLGSGQHFVLDLIDNNLTVETRLFIDRKYYFGEQSAYCIRGDKLLECLTIHQAAAKTSISIPPNLPANHSLPPCISPSVGKDPIGFSRNTEVDRELQNLQNGLRDLRILTRIESNDMNQYARTSDQPNIIAQNLPARNETIGVSTINTRHFTPPSDVYYQEQNLIDLQAPPISASSNDFRQQNNGNPSRSRNVDPFQLTAVNPEGIISNENNHNFFMASQLSTNLASQHTENLPVVECYKPLKLIIDEDLQLRNKSIGASSTNKRHFSLPSDENDQEHNLIDFQASPIANNVIGQPNSEKKISNDKYQNYLEAPQPSSNYSSQNTENAPVEGSYKPIESTIDQNLQARHERIAKHLRHFTPPFDDNYQEHNLSDSRPSPTANNVPDAILRKMHLNTENLSISSNLEPFQLPVVNSEEKISNVKYQNSLEVAQPSLNYASQHTENSTNGGSYKPLQLPAVELIALNDDDKISNERPQTIKSESAVVCDSSSNSERQIRPLARGNDKLKKQQNQNIDESRCYKCRTLVANIIELKCKHLFCLRCLIVSFKANPQNTRCPFKKDNFQCDFRFELIHITNNIFNTIDNTVPVTKTKSDIVETRSVVNKVEEAAFEYNYDDDSNEVLFYCKHDRCEGAWFVDKTEDTNMYRCPICEKYNCFKCQVIHEGLTCAEYNQPNRAHLNNTTKHPN